MARTSSSRQLYFITGNAGKFREVQSIIPDIRQLALDLDEIQSLDPRIVIEHKLAQAASHHDGAFIVEDTSVHIRCLKGLPGTMAKWWLEALGVTGLADLVLRYDDHTATVSTAIGYRDEQGSVRYFVGEYGGRIVRPRGTDGFGFDPIFIPEGHTRTNAELSTPEKNTVSARGQAVRQLAEFLQTG